MINADMCTGGDFPGSPEGTVIDIFNEQGMDFYDERRDIFMYYSVKVSFFFPIISTSWS